MSIDGVDYWYFGIEEKRPMKGVMKTVSQKALDCAYKIEDIYREDHPGGKSQRVSKVQIAVKDALMACPDIDFTHSLVRIAFGGKADKSGDLLARHCERVACYVNQMFPDADEATMHVALLHDIVEDTYVTLGDLASFGYTSEIVASVGLLTHDTEREDYETYVRRIKNSGDERARRVKLADNRDNSDPARHMKLEPGYSNKLMRKYAHARRILLGIDGQIKAVKVDA